MLAAMSSPTSGNSLPDHTSPLSRFLAVVAVDAVCVVLLFWAGFRDAMTAWSGGYANGHHALHLSSWMMLAVGIALGIHAIYAYWHWWIPEAGIQGILAILAVIIGLSLLSADGDGAAQQPRQQSPAYTAPTTSSADIYCSGGHCYSNGVDVGHP
jgi:cadmium resistance protein CadD (predicted permease)